MIIDEIKCSLEESDKLYEYLVNTPVKDDIIKLFENYNIAITKGRIIDIKFIGDLSTIFSKLGDSYNQGKFTVKDVYLTLQNSNHEDNISMKRKIDDFKIQILQGTIKLIITLLPTEQGLFCIDGNHRLVSYYECYKESIRSVNLTVYILRIINSR